MYYRCTQCDAAVQSKGEPQIPCTNCHKKKWTRAERNRIFEDEEVYRSGPDGSVDWKLNKEQMKFEPIPEDE